MTNEQASYWLKTLEPLIKSLHRQHGEILRMTIDDVRQEAWIAMNTIAPERLDPSRAVLGYISTTIRHRIADLARSKRSQMRAEGIAVERGALGDSYEIGTLLTLRRVIASELTEQERTIATMLAQGFSKGEISRKLGPAYRRARSGLMSKLSEALAA